MKKVLLAPDRSIVDEVAESAPHLVPVVASVMPFDDLFAVEGVSEGDDGEECFVIDLKSPFTEDADPGMSWSVGLYPDRVEVRHLHESRITRSETLSLREFWQLLRDRVASQSATVEGR